MQNRIGPEGLKVLIIETPFQLHILSLFPFFTEIKLCLARNMYMCAGMKVFTPINSFVAKWCNYSCKHIYLMTA